MADEYRNIDEYLAGFSGEKRKIMDEVRATIAKAAPDASETISWQMPTFKQKRNLIHFFAHKNHLGIYPGAEPLVVFADRLADYKTSKGAIQLRWDEPIPYGLIAEIVRFNIARLS